MLNGPRGRPTLYDPDDTRASPTGSEENQRCTLASHPSTDSGRSASSCIPPCKGEGSLRQRPTPPCKGRDSLHLLVQVEGLADVVWVRLVAAALIILRAVVKENFC